MNTKSLFQKLFIGFFAFAFSFSGFAYVAQQTGLTPGTFFHTAYAEDEDEDDEYDHQYEDDRDKDERDDDEYEHGSANTNPQPVIVRDTVSPVVQITSPEDGAVFPYDTEKVNITAKVSDNLDRNPNIEGTGKQDLDVGINVFFVTAIDDVGNFTMESVSVTRESENAEPDTTEEKTASLLGDGEIQGSPDTDGDGLTDFEEGIFQTDPSNPDSDNDGVSDGDEVSALTNPHGRGKLFSDLPADHYAKPFLVELMRSGVISGYPDGTFHADEPVTRAEALKMLMRMRNSDVPTGEDSYFPDVSPDEWFAPYINGAYESGLVQGKSDGSFHPQDPITRSEMVKITLMNYGLGGDLMNKSPAEVQFSDLDQIGWDAALVEYAAENGIVNGYFGGKFGGGDLLTRGQAAKIIALANERLSDESSLRTIALLPQNERESLLIARQQEDAVREIAMATPSVPTQVYVPKPNSVASATPKPTPAPSGNTPAQNTAAIDEQKRNEALAQAEAARIKAEAEARARAEAEAKAKAIAAAAQQQAQQQPPQTTTGAS